MGTDIHLYIEVACERRFDALFAGEMDLERDYHFFHAIAGVRSYDRDPPLFPPRGVPADLNPVENTTAPWC